MATNSQIAFNPQGNSVLLTADATPPAAVQAPVNGRFAAQETGQVRLVNAGTTVVYLGVGPTAAVAQANSVAPTGGSPAPCIPLIPGAVEILRFPIASYFSGLSSAAATVFITPGEGL